MEIIIRTTLVFWLLWLLTRGTGKKELAQLSAFELVLIVVLGDIVQQAVTQEDYSVTGAALAVVTLAAWVLLLSAVQYRFGAARRVLTGSPVVLVWDGVPLDDAMRHELVSDEDLLEAARSQGIESLDDIRAAVLEADGAVAFIEHVGDQSPDGSQTGGPHAPGADS
jgi:uncharacterized membrane protein YcaP (DUF421 family)